MATDSPGPQAHDVSLRRRQMHPIGRPKDPCTRWVGMVRFRIFHSADPLDQRPQRVIPWISRTKKRQMQGAPMDVRALRRRRRLTQREFAGLFWDSRWRLLRHWERGNRRPTGPALVLLHVIADNPRAVLLAVRKVRVTQPGLLPAIEPRRSSRAPARSQPPRMVRCPLCDECGGPATNAGGDRRRRYWENVSSLLALQHALVVPDRPRLALAHGVQLALQVLAAVALAFGDQHIAGTEGAA